jgi:outer membrane receptor protein involved in Fe transport
MGKFYLVFFLCTISLCIPPFAVAQTELSIKGKVLDAETGEPLLGVNITIKDKFVGTATDTKGDFHLITSVTPPFTLIFSMIGYEKVTKVITGSETNLIIRLNEMVYVGQEIVIAASRFEESIVKSPVTIEKITWHEISRNPAANFYDGLYQLKGVDMNVNSLTFRYPNTRGFTGESNYRVNQILDGIENVSPGLSFAAGNMFGLSELDVESVELLTGASSALYGPGGMNGTLLMTSKNPFEYQGLSATVKTGIMHVNASYDQPVSPMIDVNFRYAKVLKNKFAFKLTGSYLRATDWHANDLRDRTDLNNTNLNRTTNQGYDGVNVYGDDIIVPVNLKDVAPNVAENIAKNQGIQPGTPEYENLYNRVIAVFPDQIISRTGWVEKDLADYNTSNLKLGGGMLYRINDKLQLDLQGTVSRGTSLYTAANRFAIRNFDIGYGKLELKGKNFFLRSWAVAENSGDSYDVGGAALRLNEAWKPSEVWYADYIGAFAQSVLLGAQQNDALEFARIIADNRDKFGNVFVEGKPALPLPGTTEFNTLLNEIRNTPVNEGGTKVIDRSKLWQAEGMYNFSDKIKFIDLMVGANGRVYWIDSEGTVFFDEPGQPIHYFLLGAYAQASKSLWKDRFKVTASARYDKHEKFKGEVTPRVSVVYSIAKSDLHHIRMSYQTAFRFPSTQDQWIDLDLGFYHNLGGIQEVQNKYNFDTNPVYPLSGSNPITAVPVLDNGPFIIPTFGPEKVTALELGYRGIYMNKRLFIDTYIYQNKYNGFLANQLVVQNPFTPEEKRYQIPVNVDDMVTAMGWAFGGDLRLPKGYYFKGNVAYNVLKEDTEQVGSQSRYNTPDYRFNTGVGNIDVYKNIGFYLNYRWQNTFLWESAFGTAQMPAFGTLDAQVSLKLSNMKSILKVGGSNVLNKYYTTSFGSAQIGGLYYVSLTFDQFINK